MVIDFDGFYIFIVLGLDVIFIFSYIGFEFQEIVVVNCSVIDVEFSLNNNVFDEVVVVGYKIIKKLDFIGVVVSFDSEVFNVWGLNSLLEVVQGNVVGVQIFFLMGCLGDGFDIIICGNNFLNDDFNLFFVVDGVFIDNIDFLNLQDIEWIDILKDVFLMVIYGLWGLNGVVIVIIKNGVSVKFGVNVSFDIYYGMCQVVCLLQMMDGEKWWYYYCLVYFVMINFNDLLLIMLEELQLKYVGSFNILLEQCVVNNEIFDWYDFVL